MNITNFINQFKDHSLGRKRTYGSYRVIDGAHCKLLVKSRTRGGLPRGSSLVAITFTPELTLFNTRVFRKIKGGVWASIPGAFEVDNRILEHKRENLLESGIIEIKDRTALIEVGDTPWLFEHDREQEKATGRLLQYTSASQPAIRVGTIAEAMKNLKLKDTDIVVNDYLCLAMPSDFMPPDIDPMYRKILSTPISPLDYGFSLEECSMPSCYSNSNIGAKPLWVQNNLLKNKDKRVINYRKAIEQWNDAANEWIKRTPEYWKELHVGKSSSGIGQIIVSDKGVFIKGPIGDSWNSSGKTLKVWHRVVRQLGRIYFT